MRTGGWCGTIPPYLRCTAGHCGTSRRRSGREASRWCSTLLDALRGVGCDDRCKRWYAFREDDIPDPARTTIGREGRAGRWLPKVALDSVAVEATWLEALPLPCTALVWHDMHLRHSRQGHRHSLGERSFYMTSRRNVPLAPVWRTSRGSSKCHGVSSHAGR